MANWRTAFKSDFLASWDIDNPVILTIAKVEVKDVQLQKLEKKVVAYFVESKFPNGEIIKPMILNAGNCKTINSFIGTKETDDWKNIQVEIGEVANKGRIGEATGLKILRVVSGVRIDKLQLVTDLLKTSIGLKDEEKEYANDIINNKIANAYDKAIVFLKSKQPK